MRTRVAGVEAVQTPCPQSLCAGELLFNGVHASQRADEGVDGFIHRTSQLRQPAAELREAGGS